MESLVLQIEKREAGGKGPARRTRMAGRIPGVFYGPATPATPVQMDALLFDRGIRGVEGTHLIELRSGDSDLNGRLVLVRELQEHPVTGAAVHVDLMEVPLDKPIEIEIPLHFVGKAEGVTLGGILQPILRELPARCLPTEIPPAIEIDVSGLGMHQSIHVSDLTLPAGVVATVDDDAAVVTVVPPAAAAPEGAEGQAAGAEGEAAAAPTEGGGEGGGSSEKS